MIHYVTGDATQPQGDGPKVIAHVCNDSGGWGRGFVVAISKRWSLPKTSYRNWSSGRTEQLFELGQSQIVAVSEDIWVANMIGQHKTRATNGIPPVRYQPIHEALRMVADFSLSHSAYVHMPRIGCGLAGGNWNQVEEIIHETLCEHNLSLTVYDLPQTSN